MVFMAFNAIILSDSSQELIDTVFTSAQLQQIGGCTALKKEIVSKNDLIKSGGEYENVEYIFSTWGMPALSASEINSHLPMLKAVFYSAGSVQHFVRPFLQAGVRIFSAWAANAIPVAEFTLGQILLANKGAFWAMRQRAHNKLSFEDGHRLCQSFAGNYNAKIGIIGAGMIGRLVLNMLKAFELDCYVCDPYLPDDAAAELGAAKVELDELFAMCNVVSNHLPNIESTKAMIKRKHFEIMPQYASFINTGRGAQLVEQDLIDVLQQRKDLTAYLDVTDPEPSAEDSQLYNMENIFLTPHIAGSMKNERSRMTTYMIEEFTRFIDGTPCKWEVTADMLDRMA